MIKKVRQPPNIHTIINKLKLSRNIDDVIYILEKFPEHKETLARALLDDIQLCKRVITDFSLGNDTGAVNRLVKILPDNRDEINKIQILCHYPLDMELKACILTNHSMRINIITKHLGNLKATCPKSIAAVDRLIALIDKILPSDEVEVHRSDLQNSLYALKITLLACKHLLPLKNICANYIIKKGLFKTERESNQALTDIFERIGTELDEIDISTAFTLPHININAEQPNDVNNESRCSIQ